jgi:hypothetical protein
MEVSVENPWTCRESGCSAKNAGRNRKASEEDEFSQPTFAQEEDGETDFVL